MKPKMLAMKGFDRWSSKYEENIYWYHQIRRLKLLNEVLPERKNAAVLDVGTGTGFFLDIISKNYGFTVGIDISFKMLEIARINNRKNLLQSDVEYLPFRNSSFDCIISVETLQYLVKEPKIFFSECSRILKDGGTLIVITWSGYYGFLQSIRRRLKMGVLDVKSPKYITPKMMKKYFRKGGFEEIEHLGVSILPLLPTPLWGIGRRIDDIFKDNLLKNLAMVYLIKARKKR